MATQSSILAWRISWTEEPGRLQPTGSAKSRTGLTDFTFTFRYANDPTLWQKSESEVAQSCQVVEVNGY